MVKVTKSGIIRKVFLQNRNTHAKYKGSTSYDLKDMAYTYIFPQTDGQAINYADSGDKKMSLLNI